MSLPDPSFRAFRPSPASRLAARLALVCVLAGALAGCFQPLYADNAAVGGPALLDKLKDVEIVQIQGRLGNELRNDLIFALTGGEGNPKGAPLQMIISVDSSTSTALLNSASGLPENQIIRVTANWRVIRADDPKKVTVVDGSASGTATIDTSDQRFANYSASIDAEKRAARTVADQIKAQLAAYFIRTANAPRSAS
ncbi:LPS assembly lipoprotein LptE [Xanthobacter sp. KR7-65]|uniref:LPS assembly lipoprotein LptE n=1 Tax=Xanthobacter sp. KR7-65 TaxID=3156612 RepID=UPI0032B579D5